MNPFLIILIATPVAIVLLVGLFAATSLYKSKCKHDWRPITLYSRPAFKCYKCDEVVFSSISTWTEGEEDNPKYEKIMRKFAKTSSNGKPVDLVKLYRRVSES